MGHTATDAGGYRSDEEVAERWRHDPLALCAETLTSAGVDRERIEALVQEAEREMQHAFETAKAAAWPDPRLAFTDVQDIGAPVQRRSDG
jgi:TPP-dependent pyruvate/acetoin dehydrogenase alpha subunit